MIITPAEDKHTVLRIISHAKKLQAEQIRIERDGEDAKVTYIAESGPQTHRVESFSSLVKAIRQRCFFWPDEGDSLCVTNASGPQRRLFTSTGKNRSFAADIHFQVGKVLQFDNCRYEGISSVVSYLNLSPGNLKLLKQGITQPNGICITNAASNEFHLDASSIILALRPDAVPCMRITPEFNVEEAVALAEKRLVLLSLEMARDPLDLFYELFERLAGMQKVRCLEKTVLAYSHLRIRRSCEQCLRETEPTRETLEKLPEFLRPKEGIPYRFGRGCHACGENVYLGTLGLDSAVYFDKEIRAALQNKETTQQVGALCYRKGTRSLLEDGVEKIYAGLTSFEEVFAVRKSVPEGFGLEAQAFSEEGLPVEGLEGSFFEAHREEKDTIKPEEPRVLLVVEDDENQREILCLVLEQAGYTVLSATNGKEGIDLLKKSPVDLLVCDVMMPIMNGKEMVQTLRATSKYKDLPILMLTAVSDSDKEYELLDHGADEYCEKNVRKKVLLKRIEKLLERKAVNPLRHLLEG